MAENLLFIGSVGWPEILFTLVLVLILFGGRKIPQLAKDLGAGIREFRKSLSNASSDLSLEDDADQMDEQPVQKKKGAARKRS